MIRLTQRRNNGVECTPIVDERGLLDALGLLVRCELGFGGVITEFSETRIVTRTSLFGVVDTTIFEGSREEMRPLLQAAYYFLRADEHQEAIAEATVEAAERILGDRSGVPLYLSLAAPILIGIGRANIAMMIGLGITTEEEIRAGAQLSGSDLVAALELLRENPGMPFREILQLA